MALKDPKIVPFKMINGIDYINLKDQIAGSHWLSSAHFWGSTALQIQGHHRPLLGRPQ